MGFLQLSYKKYSAGHQGFEATDNYEFIQDKKNGLNAISTETIFGLVIALFSQFIPSSNLLQVTGSGRGLGRRLVEKFVQLGARVACVDIDDFINRETVRQINEKYPDCAKSYTCDVAKMEDVKKLKDAVKRDFGPVDILINSAGLVVGSQMCNQDEDLIKTVIEVNLTSHFYVSIFYYCAEAVSKMSSTLAPSSHRKYKEIKL